jgi:hypothetical protein
VICRSLAVGVVVAAICGCSVGLGQPCGDGGGACPSGLICSRPTQPDGGVAAAGVCDYPLRPEGEPCLAANQCEAALTCSVHFEPGGRYGTCVPRRAAGEPCFQDRDCAGGRCAGGSGQALDGACEG